MAGEEVKGLKRFKKEIVNDDDEYDLNTTNLYKVNTNKLVANVLEHQNANVYNPGKLNRNRSKTIRSPFLHNLPAMEGQSSIKPAPRIKLMPIGKAQQQKSNNAAAAAERHKRMRNDYLQSVNRSPVNLNNTRATKKRNTKKVGGHKTRRIRRRPSKASRKI